LVNLREESYTSVELPSYIKFSSLIEKISAKLNNNSQIYKQTKKLKDTCPNKKLKDTCPNKEQEDIYQDIYPSSCVLVIFIMNYCKH
jgi:hypothetical protein